MMENLLLKDFCEVMRLASSGGALNRVPAKFRDPSRLFRRFYPLMLPLRKMGLRRGLDFGCGMCAPSVLGRLMGMEIAGVDLHQQIESVHVPGGKGLCSYYLVHCRLRELHYHIVNRDTNKEPWGEFEDHSFDFVCSYRGAGMPPEFVDSPIALSKEEAIELRAREFCRVVRPGGFWWLCPGWEVRLFRETKAYRELGMSMNITVKNWGANDNKTAI